MSKGAVGEVLSRNLREARKTVGLTQRTVGEAALIPSPVVSKIEGGTHLPNLPMLVRLAGSLGVDPADLLDGLIWRPGIDGKAGSFLTAYREPDGHE